MAKMEDINPTSIFNISTTEEFQELALKIFQKQYANIPIYQSYCQMIHVDPKMVNEVHKIPFLPIEFFKSEKIIPNSLEPELIFKSSGTTNKQKRSTHFIASSKLYQKSLKNCFNRFIGNPKNYTFYSLLPSYNENQDSSLIYMVDYLAKLNGKEVIKIDHSQESLSKLQNTENNILFGVAFALLDLAAKNNLSLNHTIIIETGGMKGKRKEIIRDELHTRIQESLNPLRMVSEYGMTELLSQAYALDNTYFNTPPWMKVFVRDIMDPLTIFKSTGTGGINIIDLCNLNSCAFIATGDLGKVNPDGTFEILGRYDHSDIRGCNLMYDELT